MVQNKFMFPIIEDRAEGSVSGTARHPVLPNYDTRVCNFGQPGLREAVAHLPSAAFDFRLALPEKASADPAPV